MNMQLFTKWYVKYVILALCCVILLVVPLIKGPWIGTEPFFLSRLAQHPSLHDDLSFGGRFAAYAWGTPLVLSPAPSILMSILPLLLGLGSLLLFGRILDAFTEDKRLKYLSMLFLILSPPFIYLFSFTNTVFIPVFLALALIGLFVHGKYPWLSVLLALILPVFSIVLTAGCLVLLSLYTFWKKERQKLFLTLVFIALLSSSVYYGFLFYNTGLPQHVSLESGKEFALLSKLFYDLGAAYGLGIFLTILAALGIVAHWTKKYTALFLFCSVFFLIVASFFEGEILLLFNFFIVAFAASGFMHLAEKEWTSKHFRALTLLAMICGVVFSGISQMHALTNALPDQETLDAIHFLSEQESGTVLSVASRGAWIAAAGQKNVLDDEYLFIPDAQQRFTDADILFRARNLEEINPLLTKYDIRYVWVDDEMKKELWNSETEGLLFILEYTSKFSRIYNRNGIEIWEVS